MRSTLFALTFLSLIFAAADEASAARRRFGGRIVVTNTTPFAVRVAITQGRHLLRRVRLEPMESVISPSVRLGTNKDTDDVDGVEIFARGLEPPIRGETDTWYIFDSNVPVAGETLCFDVDGFLLDFPDGAFISISPGDCNTDPEDPGDPPAETPGDDTGQLDVRREQVTMIASSSGLMLLAIIGYVLGRAPRRRDEQDA